MTEREQDENIRDVLPDCNPKTAAGRSKPGLRFVPPVSLYELGRVMDSGQRKYGPFNWRDAGITASVYYDAAMRHLMAWWDGEDFDPETGFPHPAHAMACMAILLDAGSLEKVTDDRPAKGNTPAWLEAKTVKTKVTLDP